MTEDPRIDPADLRNVRFPGSSRRYDARAVDQFLETVAARISATNTLVDELQARITELEDAAPAPAAPAPPPPKLAHLDDDELVQLVGEETASVLSTARRAAEEIRSKAEESAARMIREATTEADQVSAEAKARAEEMTRQAEEALEQATTVATAEATRIREEATAEAEQTKSEASELAEAELAAAEQRRAETDGEVERILEEAREEGRGMVKEAKEVRTRVLEDLQRRRDTARDQIERLLAGRERLLAAYGLVRENLDDITAQLADSLPDPGEPDLPYGFVGIVGSSAQVADDDETDDVAGEASDAAAAETEVDPSDAAELDDTVAPPPVSETEAEIATGGDDVVEHVDDLDPDDTVADDQDVPDDAVADVAEAEEAEQAEDASDEPASEQPAAEIDEATDDAPAAEDEPAAEGPTELEADEAEEHAAGAGGDVDELFARLRAEREQSVAKARQVVGAEADPAPEAVADEAEVEDEVEDEPNADVPAETEAADAAESERDSRGDVDRVPAEFLADEDALEARSEALKPLDGALNRALKRRLADEQNELLDLLRRSGATTADTLLPELSAQVDGYARLAEEHLRAAAVAGGEAAGGAAEVDVSDLAAGLGAALVEPFRRRVERSASEVDGDADDLDERLRALYREWKVQHIGPVAEDALLSAYALGALRAAEPDGQVRWLIDPAQGPCPDAQDNALAGAVSAGEAFATGDVCPQAHPGCRCLLVTG